MPRSGRPKAELVLTAQERAQLLSWSRRRKSAQSLALRARIVVACADGADNKTVAAEVGCAAATVGKWRARFVEQRLDGLSDEARAGRPASITVDQVEDVVVATLESTPKNATQLDAGEDGRADRVEQVDDRADLAGLRSQTAPGGCVGRRGAPTQARHSLAVHNNGPNTRAPQVVLLAVAPDTDLPTWTTDMLAATLQDTLGTLIMRQSHLILYNPMIHLGHRTDGVGISYERVGRAGPVT